MFSFSENTGFLGVTKSYIILWFPLLKLTKLNLKSRPNFSLDFWHNVSSIKHWSFFWHCIIHSDLLLNRWTYRSVSLLALSPCFHLTLWICLLDSFIAYFLLWQFSSLQRANNRSWWKSNMVSSFFFFFLLENKYIALEGWKICPESKVSIKSLDHKEIFRLCFQCHKKI